MIFCIQVPKDGDCLYSSIKSSLQIEENSTCDKMYAARYVKHQAIAHFLEYREELFDEVVEAIRMEYGRVDSEFGPFTVREYLHFINKPREYGDFIMLKLISSMWAVKITVLRSDSLGEVRFRHDADIDDVDIVLVYNSKPINGHYSPAICVEGGEAETLEIREDLVKSKHYDPEVDRLERRSLGIWRWKEGTDYKDFISSEDEDTLEERVRGSKAAAEKSRQSREQEVPEGSIIVQKNVLEDLQKQVHDLQKSSKVVRKIKQLLQGEGEELEEDTTPKRKKGFTPAKQVQEVTAGAHICTVCNEDKGTSTNLRRHIDKVHKHNFRYYCGECNKGFMLKSGYNNHLKTHSDDKIKCTFEGCKSVFSTKKSLQKHLKLHGARKDKKCNFPGCSYSTHAKDYLQQHVKSCQYNPNRIELHCDVCDQGGFYLPKKVAEHKRINHGW